MKSHVNSLGVEAKSNLHLILTFLFLKMSSEGNKSIAQQQSPRRLLSFLEGLEKAISSLILFRSGSETKPYSSDLVEYRV